MRETLRTRLVYSELLWWVQLFHGGRRGDESRDTHCSMMCFALSFIRPKLSVVVVKKRINTRIFHDSRGLNNPPPGTVIDTEVTKPEW